MNENDKSKIDEAVARIQFRESAIILSLIALAFACYIFFELFVWLP